LSLKNTRPAWKRALKTWMAGTSPAMTQIQYCRRAMTYAAASSMAVYFSTCAWQRALAWSSLASSKSSRASFSCCSTLARSSLFTGTASSASTVSLSLATSAKPPATKMRSLTCPFTVTSMTPLRIVEISGEWPGSTPKSPASPGTTTISASSESSSFSGDTSSNFTVSAMGLLLYAVRSGRLGSHLLGLGHRLVDGADHVEGGFRQMVVLAFGDFLEAADRLGQRNLHAR